MENLIEDRQPVNIFWFRRDLRLYDNTALYHALTNGIKVLPVFIFDRKILHNLSADDKRVSFIYRALELINMELRKSDTSIRLFYGDVPDILNQILEDYTVQNVFANHDYEPYATERDTQVKKMLEQKGINFITYKDQVIFEKDEIVKSSGEPYTVFTPYSNKWHEKLRSHQNYIQSYKSENHLDSFIKSSLKDPLNLSQVGFSEDQDIFSTFKPRTEVLKEYHKTRDFPALDSTSRVSVHLRFGTVSIRQLVRKAMEINHVWLNELIWREFFMQILWHFPNVANESFRPKYRFIRWLNNESDFEAWCKGQTGYPLVDAGMRELNETGFMHNRVRMVTASFLVKHLLINWQWGEAYFAGKLLDFELSSNNGNWQWAAGTGCDAAPYFRIFNPTAQAVKFDPDHIYIKKWVPEFNTPSYPKPIVEHNFARVRCLETYKTGL